MPTFELKVMGGQLPFIVDSISEPTICITNGAVPEPVPAPFPGPVPSPVSPNVQDDVVRMKKEIGIFGGVSIILGIMLGSGIFISPSGVLQEAGSVGLTLVVWALGGVHAVLGAMCYAELGTCIPKSGGDYSYIHYTYGPLPAFLYLWDAILIFVPTANAIMGLTFANYIIQPFFPSCQLPDAAVRLVAAAVICFFTFINCWNVKFTAKAQNIFTFAKTSSLCLIIVAGLVHLYLSKGKNFQDIWAGSTTSPGKVSVSFYSGVFCYSGWSYLNFMTEELKNPYVNLPRAIYISVPIVTIIYVLANVSYLSVLTPIQMIESEAIAVTFGNEIIGSWAWVMSLTVATGALGALSVHIMTSSRMCFVGARHGHFPSMLALINVKRFTPTLSLIFLNLLSLLMLFTTDIYILITYSSFVESMFLMVSVSCLLYLRWSEPHMERPIKTPLFAPISFVAVSTLLVILPIYVRPLEVGMGVAITLSGIPAYYVGVVYSSKCAALSKFLKKTTVLAQKVFLSVQEDAQTD